MTSEEWKDIPGYEGHYQASTLGNIRSVKRETVVLKGDLQRNGYRRVYLWTSGRKRNCLVHRLVALTFIQNPNGYSDINHIDENKQNNSIDNLQWCTHLFNMNYGSVRAKIGAANTGRDVSSETRQKLRLDTARRRWINDGKTEKYVYVEQLDSFLKNTVWKKGRLPRRSVKTNV